MGADQNTHWQNVENEHTHLDGPYQVCAVILIEPFSIILFAASVRGLIFAYHEQLLNVEEILDEESHYEVWQVQENCHINEGVNETPKLSRTQVSTTNPG
jgi:hypothetical protein